MWLFLASEAMLFGSLFSGYVMLRVGAAEWSGPFTVFPWLETVLLIGASAGFGPSRARLIASHALALTFVVIKILYDAAMISRGLTPNADMMLANFFTISTVHTIHVLAGAVFTGWLAGPSWSMESA